MGVVFSTSGAFAADGVLGFIVPVLTFAIAILTASWALSRRPLTSSEAFDTVWVFKSSLDGTRA